MSAAPDILLCGIDLFFGARIETTARALGLTVSRLPERPGGEPLLDAALAIVDLDGKGDPLGWVRALRAHQQDLPIVAYVRHDASERIREGREAGASRILSRGAFSEKLPELLREARRDTMEG